MTRLFCAFIATFLLCMFGPLPSMAAPCTDGIDCYCDRVRGGDLHDPRLIMCEDFEAVTLHEDTNVGGGGPLYGPWYDDGAIANSRGSNSYWTQTYGSAGTGFWSNGDPANPIVGRTCGFSICFAGEWRADNRWQANSFAAIDIVRNGEFDDEIQALPAPTNASGGGAGVFDGRQTLAHRNGPGSVSGITGGKNWPTVFELGVTMALAYPTNSAAVNLWLQPWKHNEWTSVSSVDGFANLNGLLTFHNTSSLDENDPFQLFVFATREDSGSGRCQSALSNANVRRGDLFCLNNDALLFRADPAVYRRSTDFPLGTWGCVRGHYQNLNSSTNMSVKIWFNDKLIIDFDGLDGTFLSTVDGISGMAWNNYSNRNEPSNGSPPSTQTTYRYEDNMHVRTGIPVPCSQIGFAGSSPPPDNPPGAPAAPVNLQVN